MLENQEFAIYISDPYRIQTCNLLIRSQTLYSIELRDHFRFLRCKVTAIFVICKRFCELFLKKIIDKFIRLALSYTMSVN